MRTNFIDVTVDEEGNKNINQYQLMYEIGRGAFAKVMKAKFSKYGTNSIYKSNNTILKDKKQYFVRFYSK
jgi:hypothetical protein